MDNKFRKKKKNITKKYLVNSIAQDNNMNPKDAHQVIQDFLDKITKSLANDERLEFRDFGIFEVVTRKQKIGRNPKKADVSIVIPARSAVKFSPGKKMNEILRRKQAK